MTAKKNTCIRDAWEVVTFEDSSIAPISYVRAPFGDAEQL